MAVASDRSESLYGRIT